MVERYTDNVKVLGSIPSAPISQILVRGMLIMKWQKVRFLPHPFLQSEISVGQADNVKVLGPTFQSGSDRSVGVRSLVCPSKILARGRLIMKWVGNKLLYF